MILKVDIHTHTVSSGHAYSTLNENIHCAANHGLDVMAMTDHGPGMPGGAHVFHFNNLRILPEVIHGVRILKGIEANIINLNGDLDVDNQSLSELDFVIASLHRPCVEAGTVKENTYALRKTIDNPCVHVIGHPGDIRYLFNIPEIVKAAKNAGVALEINNSSLLPTSFRPGGFEEISKIALECIKQEALIAVGSDAHYSNHVGIFTGAVELLKKINFPKGLILNCNSSVFLNWLRGRHQKKDILH